MKKEWRKTEKNIYLPKTQPEIIRIPEYRFLSIEGEGSPGSDYFSDCISALYSLSYALKMSLKKRDDKAEEYCDYTVYPLEGVWDLNEKAKENYTGTFEKNDLVYKLMIRQPDFISRDFFQEILQTTLKKKPDLLPGIIQYEQISDGHCIQMLHIGSYDNEAESFRLMENFAIKNGLRRASRDHREIYLSDFRKTQAEKLKTVLRFKVQNAQ